MTTRIIDDLPSATDNEQLITDCQATASGPLATDHGLMPEEVRNRIKAHRKVRAADLVPHEWNFRSHPFAQRAALGAIYREVGFARSLLAFELPDGRLKLIDGHLRRDLSPDMLVDVEVLDVTEEEARQLLLTIDPLAALAQTQEQIHKRLREITPAPNEELKALWESEVRKLLAAEPQKPAKPIDDEFYILVTCRGEKEQVELLGRFQGEGLECKALVV